MAYRRNARSGAGSRYRSTRSAPARRRSTGRSRVTRSGGRRASGGNTIRLVLETAPQSPVSRNPFAPVIEAKGRGRAKL